MTVCWFLEVLFDLLSLWSLLLGCKFLESADGELIFVFPTAVYVKRLSIAIECSQMKTKTMCVMFWCHTQINQMHDIRDSMKKETDVIKGIQGDIHENGNCGFLWKKTLTCVYSSA